MERWWQSEMKLWCASIILWSIPFSCTFGSVVTNEEFQMELNNWRIGIPNAQHLLHIEMVVCGGLSFFDVFQLWINIDYQKFFSDWTDQIEWSFVLYERIDMILNVRGPRSPTIAYSERRQLRQAPDGAVWPSVRIYEPHQRALTITLKQVAIRTKNCRQS